MTPNHFIIFSHGFGVQKDSRGLFPEITQTLKDITPIFFDYNLIDQSKNEMRIQEFSKQIEILGNVIKLTRTPFKGSS